MTLVKTTVNIPEPLLTDARDRFPVTRDMSPARVLRYVLALAAGKSPAEAEAATLDVRTGVPRKPRIT
jgi:hypothetical protein